MTALIIRGDAQHLPLPDASVDLIVTSPPYYSLRSYTDGGQKLAGQVGAESTWQQYIHKLLDCTEEWIRVLKPSGSLFVNLGDKYSSATGPANGSSKRSMRPKSLLLLPERYRIAAVDRFGLIARAVIVWQKPNGLPESVTDRVRRSHEDWVHLVKQPRYYSAVDEIREPHSSRSIARVATYGDRDRALFPNRRYAVGDRSDSTDAKGILGFNRTGSLDPLGKLPGSVWSIPTAPLRVPEHVAVDHFAAFPPEIPYRLILGWSPPGICTVCGTGRKLVTVNNATVNQRLAEQTVDRAAMSGGTARSTLGRSAAESGRSALGIMCACTPYVDHPGAPPPTTPAVVLDPFGGTGTVAMVASVLGRVGITVDLSQDYCRLAQ